MSKYRISMNGKTYEMEIELIDEKAEKVPQKSVLGADMVFNKGRVNDPVVRVMDTDGLPSEHQDNDLVVSPMPGVVVRILCEAGQTVSVGQAVLVLEAMKMENEICAPKSGKIKEIYVAAGETVSGNAGLFEMESED